MEDDHIVMFVEIPTGSRNKYEVDAESGTIMLDRMLFTAMRYPGDYGFVEDTLGGDGDPLDALVFLGEPTFPGCRIRVRPVGLFRMADEKGQDEKILCVPLQDPMWSSVHELEELPGSLRAEVEQFFTLYKQLEGKRTDVGGFGDRAEAHRVIAEARARLAGANRSTEGGGGGGGG